MNKQSRKRTLLAKGLFLSILALTLILLTRAAVQASQSAPSALDQTGTQWAPYLEWELTNASYSGNPFDLIATATFVHTASGETRTTEMFYAGGDLWKFRFTGTRTGAWTFATASGDPDLAGHSGTVTIDPNPDPEIAGFVTHYGNRWGRTGLDQAFVPQFVMVSGPHGYHNNPGQVDADIQTFVEQHGFTGFHTPVFCRWFDINEPKCSNIGGPSPDPDVRTFEALELMITQVHEAGGLVHIWAWGDNARQQNPNTLPGGINGAVDVRLQRYIAARLGPLPGWTMGYGFDLWEWVSGSQLTTWHDFMQARLGWMHYLGARGQTNQLTQLSEAMDYASYEQHKPDYATYVATIDERPSKPAFSEDRFRVRNEGRSKDYNMEETRRGLWDSAMAGGVANIWGYLMPPYDCANDGACTSGPYPNPEWIKTNAVFFEDRFSADLTRCNSLTDGVCLKRPSNAHYLFYHEDATSIQLDLSGMNGAQQAVAVDAAKPYAEINLGPLSPSNQAWTAPYSSDWAIAVGDFGIPAPPPSPTPDPTGTPPPNPTSTPPPGPTSTPGPPPAGDIGVNFQPENVPVPGGYLSDAGRPYSNRGNGYTYGWDSPNNEARDRNSNQSPDQRYDTLTHLQKQGANHVWEIALSNGDYQVFVVAGDPAHSDGRFQIKVEGVMAIDGEPTAANRWLEGTVSVTVSDGRLTISSGPLAFNNKINFVMISTNGEPPPTPDPSLFTNHVYLPTGFRP